MDVKWVIVLLTDLYAIVLPNVDVAKEREVEGDLFLQDAGQGMAFRPGTFDGAIR